MLWLLQLSLIRTFAYKRSSFKCRIETMQQRKKKQKEMKETLFCFCTYGEHFFFDYILKMYIIWWSKILDFSFWIKSSYSAVKECTIFVAFRFFCFYLKIHKQFGDFIELIIQKKLVNVLFLFQVHSIIYLFVLICNCKFFCLSIYSCC